MELLRLLIKVDGLTGATGIHTLVTLNAIILIDGVYEGNRLLKRDRDGLPHPHVHVPVIGVLNGADIPTLATASAVIRNDVPWILPNPHPKITHKTLHTKKIRIRYYLNIRMTGNIYHLRTLDTDAAVQSWKRFVELCHVPSYAFAPFQKAYLEAHFGEVKGCVDPCDSTA
ncbi:MAG: hypothetical protein AOA65_1969 [Candidatus Bathyarchaeota archaeon BA1]|nr:MAG: hypothetical protein AOA65_1969 [Candidatus Bathyarchaeota archaeon BA1]